MNTTVLERSGECMLGGRRELGPGLSVHTNTMWFGSHIMMQVPKVGALAIGPLMNYSNSGSINLKQ